MTSAAQTQTRQLEHYLQVFAGFRKRAVGHSLPWLRALRENAFERFCSAGFPTTRDEDWRFTNISPIAETPFELSSEPIRLSPRDLDRYRMEAAACDLVFVNGRFSAELSTLGDVPAGVHVSSLAKQFTEKPAEIEHHLGAYLDTERDAFCALNTGFAEDGAYIHIGRGVVLSEPVHLLFVSTGAGALLMTHPHNLIVAEEGSQAAVIEDYISLGDATSAALSNTATELVARDNATVSHYLIEREDTRTFNVSTLRIQQGRSANVASHSLLIGAAIVRNNVHPVLAGEGGECLINGLFIGNGRQHLDNYMYVEHAKPHCSSRQFYNGILDGHSHGVFHGRIIVHKDAQKTDAKQTNRNLLLSDDAQIDTKPQLEIYADDVKCTHGATIGQIEEGALFYLRSRGVDEISARKLLLLAFASECLERMKEDPVRAFAEKLINESLFEFSKPPIAETSGLGQGKDPGRRWEEVG